MTHSLTVSLKGVGNWGKKKKEKSAPVVSFNHLKALNVSQIQSLPLLSAGLYYGSRILDDFIEEAREL